MAQKSSRYDAVKENAGCEGVQTMIKRVNRNDSDNAYTHYNRMHYPVALRLFEGLLGRGVRGVRALWSTARQSERYWPLMDRYTSI